MRTFLRFVAGLLGFTKRRDLKPIASIADGDDPDVAVLKQLRRHGSDLNKPTHVRFYLYVPTKSGASRIAERWVDGALVAEVCASASGDGSWLCLFQGNLVPTESALRHYRAVFEALAAGEGGEYDGWEAAITK
jgi:hypothetical protein